MSPISKALYPSSLSAVNINSFALDSPINLEHLWVPPAPGIIAKEVSGKPI